MTEYLSARIRGVHGTRSGDPGVVLQACPPGAVDDYGSLWKPDTFDRSLQVRKPVLCWAHDWTDPFGPCVRAQATHAGPVLEFRFSSFDAVPSARRAHAQLQDGTITDCSVGFSNATRREPTASERSKFPGVREIIENAQLDEVSLVLRGAVPGAKVLATRSATISEGEVYEIARKVADGVWTRARAEEEIRRQRSASVRSTSTPHSSGRYGSRHAEQNAEMDATLALLDLGRWL